MAGTSVFSSIEIQLPLLRIDVFINILAKLNELEQVTVKWSVTWLDTNATMLVVSDEHVELFNKLSHTSGHSLCTLPLLETLHGG